MIDLKESITNNRVIHRKINFTDFAIYQINPEENITFMEHY